MEVSTEQKSRIRVQAGLRPCRKKKHFICSAVTLSDSIILCALDIIHTTCSSNADGYTKACFPHDIIRLGKCISLLIWRALTVMLMHCVVMKSVTHVQRASLLCLNFHSRQRDRKPTPSPTAIPTITTDHHHNIPDTRATQNYRTRLS